MTRVVLIHGAATTARIWAGVVAALPDMDVVAVHRPSTGDLDAELAALSDVCVDAIVGGVSGGATLGLALASRGVPFRAAVLHEPAAGSLVPGLLSAVAAAYAAGGVEGFGSALYGPLWSPADGPDDPAAVERDLGMFRAYEPARPAETAGPVLLTVGGDSPAVRHEVHRVLTTAFDLPGRIIPGVRHAIHLEAPEKFAALIRQAAELPRD